MHAVERCCGFRDSSLNEPAFVRLSAKLSQSFNNVVFCWRGFNGYHIKRTTLGVVTPLVPQSWFCRGVSGRLWPGRCPLSPPCPSPAPPNPHWCRVLCQRCTCIQLLCVVFLRAMFVRDPACGIVCAPQRFLEPGCQVLGVEQEDGALCRSSAAHADAAWTHVFFTEAQGQRLLCRYLHLFTSLSHLFNLIILKEFQLPTLWADPFNYPYIW